MSVPRYVMAMFPIFVLLGSLMRRKSEIIIGVLISGTLLCFFTAIFVRGWWAF
jgi:hypothetical protein